MDKKTKKKLELLNQKLQTLRKQLAGARRQQDEADEVQRLETQIAETGTEVRRLKGAS